MSDLVQYFSNNYSKPFHDKLESFYHCLLAVIEVVLYWNCYLKY